jgi:hypothetical protein
VNTGHSAQRHHAYKFERKKLLNHAKQADPFHKVKTDISKIVAFLGAIFKKSKHVGGPKLKFKR